MPNARTYADGRVKAAVRELLEAGRPTTRDGVEGLLIERHDGRGTPHRWTLEDQITTAARGIAKERRLSRDDHEQIKELMQVVPERLTDAAAEMALWRDDAHEEYRRQAAAQAQVWSTMPTRRPDGAFKCRGPPGETKRCRGRLASQWMGKRGFSKSAHISDRCRRPT